MKAFISTKDNIQSVQQPTLLPTFRRLLNYAGFFKSYILVTDFTAIILYPYHNNFHQTYKHQHCSKLVTLLRNRARVSPKIRRRNTTQIVYLSIVSNLSNLSVELYCNPLPPVSTEVNIKRIRPEFNNVVEEQYFKKSEYGFVERGGASLSQRDPFPNLWVKGFA